MNAQREQLAAKFVAENARNGTWPDALLVQSEFPDLFPTWQEAKNFQENVLRSANASSFEFHELANIFPLMDEKDLEALAEDIKKLGLLNPIVLFEGKILDGRNRYLACKKLGIKPRTVVFQNRIDALAYVLAQNLERRNLNIRHKIELGEKLLPMEQEKAKKRQGRRTDLNGTSSSIEEEVGIAIHIVAKRLKISRATLERGIYVLHHASPEELELFQNEEKAISKLEKIIRRRLKGKPVLPSATGTSFSLHTGDFVEKSLTIQDASVDFVITDPPYDKTHLPLYQKLAQVSTRVLKDGGSLLVMVGQSYLLDIIQNLKEHSLTYNWTLAYLTPGGQATQLWNRKVNTFWKPILWFVKGEYTGNWIGDVAKEWDIARSATNDNDKSMSEYGQSESGMLDLMKRFLRPNQTVFDPFMGSGTTGVVALHLGCNFIGIDIDGKMVDKAKQRLEEAIKK